MTFSKRVQVTSYYGASNVLLGLLVGAAGIVFVLDVWVVRGAGLAMLYATLVLLAGWWLGQGRMLGIIAAGTSLLVVAGGFLWSGEDGMWSMRLVNHLLALLTIWITAGVVWLHRQREEKVNRLTGLLPMCSHCKKVRDDKGFWSQVEQYFEEHHADLQFTHGLCPVCSKQLYPELFPKLSEQYPEVYK